MATDATHPHFTMKGISKEIFKKLCPVLAW